MVVAWLQIFNIRAPRYLRTIAYTEAYNPFLSTIVYIPGGWIKSAYKCYILLPLPLGRTVRSPTTDSQLWLVPISHVVGILLSDWPDWVAWESLCYNLIIAKRKLHIRRVNQISRRLMKIWRHRREESPIKQQQIVVSRDYSDKTAKLFINDNHHSTRTHKHTTVTSQPSHWSNQVTWLKHLGVIGPDDLHGGRLGVIKFRVVGM